MPTYAYTCRDCAQPLEVVQSFSDDPLTECPACGGSLRKKFSSVGVVFKGGGFYKTDSRGGAAAAKPSGEADGAGAGKGDGGEAADGGSGSSSTTGSTGTSSGDGSGSSSTAGGSAGSSSSTGSGGATKASSKTS